MNPAKMQYTAGLIIIGNEILSGRTRDTNLAFLGQQLDRLGIGLAECRIIPDIEKAIIDAVNDYKSRLSYVFTTGGIGPTHDDITSAAIARCFGKPLLRNRQAVEKITAFHNGDELNEARLKMAHIPDGAVLIDNPVSGAPGFQIDNVYVLAGVPVIMQAMFSGMTDRLAGGVPMETVNIITDLREAGFAAPLKAIQDQHTEVSIGSYPFFRSGRLGVNLVLRSIDTAMLEIVKQKIDRMIGDLGGEIFKQAGP